MSSVIIKTSESNPTQVTEHYIAIARPQGIVIYERDGNGIKIQLDEKGIEEIRDLKSNSILFLIHESRF